MATTVSTESKLFKLVSVNLMGHPVTYGMQLKNNKNKWCKLLAVLSSHNGSKAATALQHSAIPRRKGRKATTALPHFLY